MATRPSPYQTAPDSRPPPPPFNHHPAAPPPQQHPHHQQHPQQQHPYYQQHPDYQQHPAYAHPHPPPPPPPPSHHGPPPPGLSLPPIQSHPGAAQPPPPDQQQQPLPPYRHPSVHDPRDGPPPSGPDYQYNHTRSGHATPAPVNNRSYSHDSGHPQQRTPTTPAAPGPYQQPTSAPDSHGPPPPHHMDHGQHAYPPTNGVQHGLPPPPQGPPPPGHEPPQYMTPVMHQHDGYGPPQQQPPPHMYAQQPYGPPNTSMFTVHKKKQMRATQACEQCRQRKQKCDEGVPCSFCKENSLSCTYRETPPAKTDKNMEKVISHLEALQGVVPMLSSLADKVNGMDERIRRIEYDNPQTVAGAQSDQTMTDEPETIKNKPQLDDHRTAPHKLILLWPSVRPLMENAQVDVNDGYVMEAEDRGVLRLYGRGEGIDEHDGTQPGGAPSPARSEESGEVNVPTPPEGVWGTGFAAQPPEIRRSEPYNTGGLKPDGSLDLDVNTINALYESYMKHMHIMHPFLDRARVRKLFDTFITRYGTGNKPRFPNHTFAVGSNESDRPLKRQRSNGSTSAMAPGVENTNQKRTLTERSPGNGIVYLVMALGKICAHKDPLPAFAQDSKLNTNANIAHQLSGYPGYTGHSPLSANIKPSPTSPKSTPAQATPLSTESGARFESSRSRRSSFDGPLTAGLKNMDVIPGIAYYAKAAEILGDQGDGYDLVHAQMFLLAGLYKGQLARVKESMSWITMAGRATQSLLERYKLYNNQYWSGYGDIRARHQRGQEQIKDKRHNLIVLASWTCLQLESDILAELRLPSSGIQSIENLLLMPHNIADEDESYAGLESDKSNEGYNDILVMYSAQMYLRRRLNQVHREMYGPECLGKDQNEVQEMLMGHEQILGAWRQSLPPQLRWQDLDPAPQDILSARLRAKYWGAKYIVNRPFLDYALHIMPHVQHPGTKTVEEVSLDAHGNPRDKAEIHLFKAIEGMGAKEIWQASKRCIEAAMQSTVAFDGVPGRLIVTNIHGTAHAQFGNMLVLAAAYYNTYLKQLIDGEKFKELLERTIQFLRRLAPISPTCSNDCQILEKINRLLFGIPADAKHFYRNEVEPSSASNSFTT